MSTEYTLPETGFVRQKQLIPSIIPFSRTTLWRMVKDGTFPTPVKLTTNVTAWRVEDVREWMAKHGSRFIPLVSATGADHVPRGRTSGASTASVHHESRHHSDVPVQPRAAVVNRSWEAKLVREAEAWRHSEAVRAYAAHVLRVMITDGRPPSTAVLGWLKAAIDCADRKDPTKARLADLDRERGSM